MRLDAFYNLRCRLHSNSNDDEHNSPASANSAHRSVLAPVTCGTAQGQHSLTSDP